MPRVRKVQYKLNPEEAEVFQIFCNQLTRTGERDFVGMDRNEIAKRALFYAISDARRRAEEMQLAQLEAAANHTPTDLEQANATTHSSEVNRDIAGGDASGSTDTAAHTNETDTNTETAGLQGS